GQDPRAAAAVGGALRRLQEAGGESPDLRMWLLLALVLGESGDHQRALALVQDTAAQMRQQGYHLFLAVAELYGAHLAGHDNQTARREALRRGWDLVASDDTHFLPMLPTAALKDVALAALRAGIAVEAVGRVLRHQAPEHARELLEGLLGDV